MLFGNWLEATRRLQEDVYGVDYDAVRSDPDAFANYLVIQLFAAVDEISEVADEIGWKPWSKSRGWVNEDNALKEIVDVLHFVANVAAMIGITDSQLEQAYIHKMRVNEIRQRIGYEQANKPLPLCTQHLPNADGGSCLICGKHLGE